ncbi:MAG: peptidoglycan-binding protein [Polyangiaceae bacterium]|nr:peptidoglycan-binding protein [Polyangiaceae bacterium]
MTPHVVRSGDHLLKLAARMQFDATEVWNHPDNADLKKARGSTHILKSGDLLYMPEPAPRRWLPVKVGKVNRFVATLPMATMTVTFVSEHGPIAGQACRIRELPEQKGLATDAQGNLTFRVPVAVATVTVEWVGREVAYELRVGDLDPVDTRSGVLQRLLNLGFILDFHLDLTTDEDELLRQAIAQFQSSQVLDPTGELNATTIDKLRQAHGC